MKNYWKHFCIGLFLYIGFGYIFISTYGKMSMPIKITVTGFCMIYLFSVGIRELSYLKNKLWKIILIIPLSITLWALSVDLFTGLFFHGNPFYLGNSWPDNLIKMPGELYFILKSTAALVFSGLLYYIR